MRAVCILLLIALSSSGCVAKQVQLSPPTVTSSPPPPAAPTGSVTTFNTPGFVFSFVIPGATSLPSAAQTAFCNIVSSVLNSPNLLPPGYNVSCSLSSVSPFNGTSVIASGFAFTTWAAVPTVTQLNTATALRNAAIATLTNQTALNLLFQNTGFNGTQPLTACFGTGTVTALAGTTTVYNTTINPIGNVKCGAKLTFATSDDVVNQVGIDNGNANSSNKGKFCSTPAVSGGVVGVVGSGSCVQYGVVASAAGTGQARLSSNPVISAGAVTLPTTTFSSQGSGYTSAPNVTVSPPSPVAASITITVGTTGALTAVTSPTENGPYSGTFAVVDAVANAGNCISTSSATKPCSGSPIFIQTTTAATGPNQGGPQCTASDFNDASNGGVTGNSLPVTTTAVGTLTFTNILCDVTKAAPVLTLKSTFQPLVTATAVATIGTDPSQQFYGQVTGVTIVSGGSGYLVTTTSTKLPSITIAPPAGDVVGQFCSTKPISGLSNAVPVVWPSPISISGSCQPLGRDTFRNTVCSTPAVAGGVLSPINSGSCNVENSFITTATARRMLLQTSTNTAILPQTFVTTPTGQSTSPSPPASPPSTPTASPPSNPSPVYRGRFQIGSVACKGRFLAASGSCGDRLVYLRTTAQSKGSRTFWAIDGVAGTPTGVAAVVRVGKCNGNTNLASAQSTPTPVIGGGSWKVIITPVDSGNPNVVTLQATDKTYKGKFLQVGDKCDDQKGFTWAAKSSSTSQQWTITSVSNLQ